MMWRFVIENILENNVCIMSNDLWMHLKQRKVDFSLEDQHGQKPGAEAANS